MSEPLLCAAQGCDERGLAGINGAWWCAAHIDYGFAAVAEVKRDVIDAARRHGIARPRSRVPLVFRRVYDLPEGAGQMMVEVNTTTGNSHVAFRASQHATWGPPIHASRIDDDWGPQ